MIIKYKQRKNFKGRTLKNTCMCRTGKNKKNFKKFLREEEKSNIRNSSVEIYEKVTKPFFKCFRDLFMYLQNSAELAKHRFSIHAYWIKSLGKET